MKVSPKQMLSHLSKVSKNLDDIRSRAVFVGLPSDKIGGAVYGDGQTILSVGVQHEYGAPEQGIPQRSFIRAPLRTKKEQIDAAIAGQLEKVIEGRMETEVALGRIGIIATNVIKGAFTSGGYGSWRPLSARTVEAKKSSQILIDTGLLRRSIAWVVRRVA